MDKFISTVDNTSKTLDGKLFGEFTKKLTVWDYPNINRESYLSLSHDDKEIIIRQYYFDIKARSNCKFGPISCLLCL